MTNEHYSIGKSILVAICAVIGFIVLQAVGIRGFVGGAIGALLGSGVGILIYDLIFKRKL